MPTIERFMVQAYRESVAGGIEAEEPVRTPSAGDAIRTAKEMVSKKVGVIAYAWRGDPRNHEIGKLVVLMQSGVLPFCVALAFEKDRVPDPGRNWPV